MLKYFSRKRLKSVTKVKQKRVYSSQIVMSSKNIMNLPQGELSYELQLKYRKTIGIYIQAGEVVVRAPYGMSMMKIESFLYDKSGWVWLKLKEQAQNQVQQKCIFWGDGGSLSYLGRELVLRLNDQTYGVVLSEGGVLEVGRAQLAGKKKQHTVAELIQQWMQQQALILFKQKCEYFGDVLGVRPEKVALTAAKTRWGSTNSRGYIRLHWRLLQMPHEVIDYVVVHELAHLKEMNHGHRFWAVVESVLPDYAQRRKKLKLMSLPIW